MSTSWSLCCTDYDLCSASYDGGKEMLQEVVRAWPQIKALIDLPDLWYVEVKLLGSDGSDVFFFLREHEGRTLSLESEYGRKESL